VSSYLIRLAGALIAFLTLLSPVIPAPQVPVPGTAKPAPQTKPDFSQEPFVIESLVTRARFENDGKGCVETTARIRVQNDAGVKALSQLTFPYNSAAERLEITYARVRRADGTVATTPPENIRDASAQVVRDAPVYSAPREKQVSLAALHPGETLEYQSAEVIFQPLAPSQFWFEYQFEKNAIALEQRLELDVPAGRALKLKTRPAFEPLDSKGNGESGRHVYRWAASHTVSEDAATQRPDGETDVRVSTFASWEEIGAWYRSLEDDRAGVTPEIQKKADELTQGRATPLDKLEALYDYVATKFRYINLPFGAGEVEPRAAAAVLKNDYADSKDRHTLLAALAAAEGMKGDAVLIHSQRNLDMEVPSPAGVNHVLSRFQVGGKEIWLDTSTEVAPFRLLPSPLRNKRALAVPAEGSAALVETPADPPFPVRQLWHFEGTISDLGKLDARVHYVLGGDNELLLRLAFRRAEQTKWKEIGQAIAAADGLRGDVDQVTPSDPADTHHPFTLDYHVVQAGFLDWTKRRVDLSLPMPPLALPEAGADSANSSAAIALGSPAEVRLETKLTAPARYSARAPAAVNVERDYGEYRSVYGVAGEVLSASRTLNIRQRELPADRAQDYALFFRRAVRNDEAQTFLLEAAAAGTPAVPESASADDLLQAATRAYSSQQFPLAERLLERVVTLDPRHKRAWKLLGAVRLAQQENAAAVEAFRKQIELEPRDEFAYEGLGLAQAAQQQYDEAIASFRKQLEVKPLDPMAQASLGTTLYEAHRYPEAVKELEKAVALSPEDPRLYLNLGRAELNLDHAEKALAAFEKAAELNPSPAVWNAAASELARHGAYLDRAQQYAESAVAGTATELSGVTLDKLTPRDLARVAALGSYWDTLGWVLFQRGEWKRAREFVEAAWRLTLSTEVAEHVARINEKQGRPNSLPPQLRYEAGRLLPEGAAGAADFFVLLTPTSHEAEAVKFIRGDSGLRDAGEKLRGLNYGRMFPDDRALRIVRRGTLSCAEGKQACTFTLLPAGEARSMQ
jgi:tetratricopeptide (TPR) repeat protein/transglutaminase-like putative cysteine protease